MTGTTRERNMRWILLIFALLCLLLAGYFFFEVSQLEQQLRALAAGGVAQTQPVRKLVQRTRPLAWAALGAGILLIVSALVTGRSKAPPQA